MMRTKIVITLVAGAALFQFAVNVQLARAGLLSNLNIGQAVTEQDVGVGLGHSSQAVTTDTTAPFQRSATAQDESGGSLATVTANYSVTDNGLVATFDISASGSLTALGWGVSEQTDEPTDPDMFDLTQPCRFTWTFSCTGPTNSSPLGGSGLQYNDPGPGGINGDIFNSTRTYSGTMGPGPVVLTESWNLNQYAAGTTTESGTDSISLTFYATEPIPEPSTAVLIGLSAVAMLGRRRRPPASPSRREGDRNSVASGQAL